MSDILVDEQSLRVSVVWTVHGRLVFSSHHSETSGAVDYLLTSNSGSTSTVGQFGKLSLLAFV